MSIAWAQGIGIGQVTLQERVYCIVQGISKRHIIVGTAEKSLDAAVVMHEPVMKAFEGWAIGLINGVTVLMDWGGLVANVPDKGGLACRAQDTLAFTAKGDGVKPMKGLSGHDSIDSVVS